MRPLLACLCLTALMMGAAHAADLAPLPLRIGLAAAKASPLPGHPAAHLVCSDDDATVSIGGSQFPASALGNGTPGDIACRWFELSGTTQIEVKSNLAGVTASQSFEFVAPDTGAEPQLYHVLGDGDPADYDKAVAAISASEGPPASQAPIAHFGRQANWQTNTTKLVVTEKGGDNGGLSIELLDRPLEQKALTLY